MKMKNFFKILDLPQKLVIDHNELKKQYFKLLKAKPASEEASYNTVLIEQAYQTLKDRFLRIEHLLQVEGVEPVSKDKVPLQFSEIVKEVETLLPLAKKGDQGSLLKLKKLHTNILNEFSSVSIELANLEKAWDSHEAGDTETILKRLNRKTAAFHFIRNVEQDIRQTIN